MQIEAGKITVNLVDVVPKTFQLLHSTPCLLVGVIPSTNSAHAGRLVASVALRAVIKVRIWSTRTIPAGSVSGIPPSRAWMAPYTHMFPVIAMCGHR